EEVPAAFDPPDRAEQLAIVRFAVKRVDRGRVHDQERRLVEVVEEARVRLAEPLEVALLGLLLERDAAGSDPFQQHARRRLEIDHEVRLRRLDLQRGRDLIVELELLRIEVQLREQAVLLDQEIGDPDRGEHVGLPDLLDLAGTLEQEEDLRRQRRLAGTLVEALEERILLRLLEDQLAREALREPLRKARLADADRPLDD